MTRGYEDKEWIREDFRLTCRRAKRLFAIHGMSDNFKKILQDALHKITRRDHGEREQTSIEDMNRFALKHIRICQNPAQWRRLVFSFSRIAATTADEEEASTASACIGQMYHENGTRRQLNSPMVGRHESISTSEPTCDTAANIRTCANKPQTPSMIRPAIKSEINAVSSHTYNDSVDYDPEEDEDISAADSESSPSVGSPKMLAGHQLKNSANSDINDNPIEGDRTDKQHRKHPAPKPNLSQSSRAGGISKRQYTKRPLRLFSLNQRKILDRTYQSNPHPSREERGELAKQFNVTYKQISTWFMNRRKPRR